MIRNIVFDMGRVLIHWSGEQLMEKYDLPEEDRALLNEVVFSSIQWVQLDRGSITEAQALEVFLPKLPERLHGVARELVCFWWQQPLRPIAGMDALIRELKKNGYGIYVLSNAGLPLRQYWPRLPGADCFDGVVVSAEEKLLKPQPEIFRVLLSRYELKPEECVFIDDSLANAEGAVYCGMEGIFFKGDSALLRRQLRALGVNCEE